MNLDRFQPPTSSDNMASCVCCGERVHYENLNSVNECPLCSEYFEEDDMSEQDCLELRWTIKKQNTPSSSYWDVVQGKKIIFCDLEKQTALSLSECHNCCLKEIEAMKVLTASAVSVAERLKKEVTKLTADNAVLREALEDCERLLRFIPAYNGKDDAIKKAQAALALKPTE